MELWEALFAITKTWKPCKCPSTEEWIKKFGTYIYNRMLAIKKEQNNASARTQMQPEVITPSEVNQKEKDKQRKSERERHCITHMWDPKRGTNEPTMKQKENHRHGEQTCGCQGEGSGRAGTDWEFGVRRCRCRTEVLLCSTGNYTQSPEINHNGKTH